jgi:signal transduction histidine kinase
MAEQAGHAPEATMGQESDGAAGREAGARQAAHGNDARLAAALAHEIRNPLNGASLYLSIVERELARSQATPRPVHEALRVVRSELHRISSFVTDFLEFARPAPLHRAPLDVNAVVGQAVEELRPTAEALGVDLQLEPAPEAAMARVDKERLERAIFHLTENALEAARRGGRAIVRVVMALTELAIEVEDDGPGIPAQGAHVFDAFYTTKANGTGLGLSIVRRIVEDHGGDLSYASAPGRTVFRLRLPSAIDV